LKKTLINDIFVRKCVRACARACAYV